MVDILKKQVIAIKQGKTPLSSGRVAGQGEVRIVGHVFSRLVVLRPAWKNAVVGDVRNWANRYKAELLEAFKEHGVNTEEAIERGLRNARNEDSDFLPNPGRFVKWCKPERVHACHRVFEDKTALGHLPAGKKFTQDAISKIFKEVWG
jgi:hypothetical protein